MGTNEHKLNRIITTPATNQPTMYSRLFVFIRENSCAIYLFAFPGEWCLNAKLNEKNLCTKKLAKNRLSAAVTRATGG